MQLNGNLVMNSDGTGEIQNLHIESVTSDPTGQTAANAGRIIYNSTEDTIKFFHEEDLTWQAVGGAAAIGHSNREPARAATTANIANFLTAAPNVLDGVTLVLGNRLLLKDQTDASENGIYEVTTLGTGADGVWGRVEDFDDAAEVVANTFVWVAEGTVNADVAFVVVSDNDISVGVDDIVWKHFADTFEFTSATRTTGNITDADFDGKMLQSLDSAIGANSDLTVQSRTTGAVSLSTSVYGMVNSLDDYLGADVVPVARTNSPLVIANDVGSNLEALDAAIGVTVTSTNVISTGASVTTNLSSLDAEQGYIDVFIGKTAGNTTPVYTSQLYVTNGDDLEAAIGKLDAGIQAAIQGLDVKESVKVATGAALPAYTAAGTQDTHTLTMDAVGIVAIDGEDITAANGWTVGNRILVKNEGGGTHVDNGIYTVTTLSDVAVAMVLTRASDFDDTPGDEVTANAFTFVAEGASELDTGWVLTTNDPVVIDTTALTFAKFSSAGGLGALQAEIDAIELATGLDTDGTFISFSSTNHIDGSTSIAGAIELLDAEIGADVVAVTRTNNPIINGAAVNANVDALDEAVGTDAELGTPVTRTTGILVINTSLMAKFAAVDTYLGNDVVPVSRTNSPLVASNDIGANLEALDATVGTDAEMVNQNYVNDANSVNTNLSILDGKVNKMYYTQGYSSTVSQVVNHTLGVKFCNVTVVDSTDKVLIPESITFTDTNNLTVTFNSAIAFTVVVMGLA